MNIGSLVSYFLVRCKHCGIWWAISALGGNTRLSKRGDHRLLGGILQYFHWQLGWQIKGHCYSGSKQYFGFSWEAVSNWKKKNLELNISLTYWSWNKIQSITTKKNDPQSKDKQNTNVYLKTVLLYAKTFLMSLSLQPSNYQPTMWRINIKAVMILCFYIILLCAATSIGWQYFTKDPDMNLTSSR